MKKFKINKTNISQNKQPYLIAEISANHQNSVTLVKRIIDRASLNNINAVKLQTYSPDTITLNSSKKYFRINDKNSIWKNRNLYDLYSEGFLSWKKQKELINYSKKKKITCFSSVFDESSVDYLEKLNIPAYKIASFETNHFPLLEKVAKTKKPLIISTGVSDLKEILEIKKILDSNMVNYYSFLKCTSQYPAMYKNLNLKTIPEMRKKLKCEIGFSDHTKNFTAMIAAISQGATIIEKHFKFDFRTETLDSKFSASSSDFKDYRDLANQSWESLGKINFKKNLLFEKKSINLKRSIFISKNVKKNEKLSQYNIKIVRPNNGMHPKYYNEILGKKFSKNLSEGTPLNKKMFS